MMPNAKPLRILDTGLRPVRWNVAMTAALAELQAGGATPGWCVRFHRYPTCVLLGAGQDLEQAADVDWCRRFGVEIARRVTGGGAVYMGPGMLAWDVLVDCTPHGGFEGVTRAVCTGVAAGLSRLGLEAQFRAPNDIAIRDRKVSGTSGYSVGGGAVLQGTVLIADDFPAMAPALRLPEAALRERVTCLEVAIGAAPALPAVVESITLGLAEALRRKPVAGEVSPDELALCEALLRDEFGTDAYVAGRGATPA